MNKVKTGMPYAYKQSAEALDIYLYDDIEGDGYDWWTGETIKSDTSAKSIKDVLEDAGNISSINLHINSNGGDVKEGFGIYSLLSRHPAQKICYIDGFAASIASVIAMSCDKIVMSPVSLMFIHNAWMVARGNSQELRKQADDLDTINSQSVTAYKLKCGEKITDEQLKNFLDAETWLTAEQCLEYGFADEVETKQKIEQEKTVAQKLIDGFRQKQIVSAEAKEKSIVNQLFQAYKDKGFPKK